MTTVHQQALWEESTSQAFGAIREIAGDTARWTLVTTRDDVFVIVESHGDWPRLPDGWLDVPVLTACATRTVHELLMGWRAT